MPPVAHTGRKVQLRRFEGRTKEIGTANVLLKFDKNDWQGEVAMVKGDELNGKSLFAVSVKDSKSWGILCAYAGKENSKDIDVVMTRNMVKERENEEKEDEEIIECEKAGTSELSLVSADDEELEWDCDEELEEDCDDEVLDDIRYY